MKICHVTTRYFPAPGGVETFVKETAERLANIGYNIDIYTTDLYTEIPWKKETFADASKSNINISRFRAYSLPGNAHYPIVPSFFYRLVLNRYDLLHVHTYGTFQSFIAPFLRHIKGKPLIISTHFHPPQSMWGGKKRESLRIFYDTLFGRQTLESADRIIVESTYEKKTIDTIAPGSDTVIIPPGTDTEWIRYEYGANFKKIYNIEKEYLLFVGRLASNKGIIDLIHAFKMIKKDIDVDLVLAGPDSGEKEIIEKIIEKEDVRGVHMPGFLDKATLASAYKGASLFVFPSHFEAFGLVLLDAMAAGVPIISTRVGGIPDLITPDTGTLINPGDPKQLATEIVTLYNDHKKKDLFRKNGMKKIEYYSWDRVAADLDKLYHEVSS